MIRIIDEPVIELTANEHRRLLSEYHMQYQCWCGVQPPPTFETWLLRRGTPTTVLGRISP